MTDDFSEPTEGSSGPESDGDTDSPSMEFLRNLAHISDQRPSAFDRLVLGGTDVSLGDPSDRFLIRRRLGAGGFGTVYEALDCERHATVALKVLRRRDGQSIVQFKAEFRSLAETVHPNLVQLYELHVEGDEWLFTMEFIRGKDALEYVRPSGGPYDEQRLRAVFRQLADGLCFLHRSGKLHRDVKPSNVMVTDEGRVVIVDFGLVSDIHDRQAISGVFGTPAYMAPEQAAGLPVGPAADWYAVGVMLYQALTGRLPNSEPHEAGPPSSLVADVPDDLDRLCVDLLARRPDHRPTGGEVRRRLAVEQTDAEPEAEPSTWPSGDATFVGRTAQLAELADALRAAEQGASVVVLLHGRSGMGKTGMAQRFLAEIRDRDPGRLALIGRCFEQESVPYKGVDELVDALFHALRKRPIPELAAMLPADFPMLTRLFPQLRGLGRVDLRTPAEGMDDLLLRQRAFGALGELLGRAAPHAPVLVVDDLQWADLDGIAALTALVHGPLLLVTTYRMEDADSAPVLLAFFAALASLADRVDVRHVEVGPLDDRDAAAILVAEPRVGRALSAETVRALVAEARGDPFVLSELARERGTLLAARIGGLAESARSLLEVVALDGQPIPRAVAEQAAYGSERESEALGSISVLRAERLIRIRRTFLGDEILPYHDRIRELVTDRIDPDTRRGHHHRLALALEAEPTAEPERLLFHYRSSGRLGDAARFAPDAARRAHNALAFDRAARLYGEALVLGAARTDRNGAPSPQTPTEDHELRVALAEALAGAGRPREAALTYLELDSTDPAELQGFRRRAAELLVGAGYADEGFAVLHEVLRKVGITLSTSFPRLLSLVLLRLRLRVRGHEFGERPESAVSQRELLRLDACYTAVLGLFMVNPILAIEPQARHLLLALESGEPVRAARAFAFEAVFTAVVRPKLGAKSDRLLEAARAIEQRVSQPRLTGWVRLCEAMVAQVSARWRPAHDLVVESESVLRQHCTGVSMEIDMARFRRADLLWLLGEVAELCRLTAVIVDEARERGNRFQEMMVQLSTGSVIGLIEDRPERAREAVASVLERWPRAPGSLIHVREIRAQARIALYEGRGDVALKWIEDGFAAMRRTGLIFARSQTAELHILRVLAALATGDGERAARYARAVENHRFVWMQSSAVMLRAALAHHAGNLDGAITLLRSCRAGARTRGEALYEAATSRRIGQWIGGSEGRTDVEASDAWMAGQGIANPERMTAMLLGWV